GNTAPADYVLTATPNGPVPTPTISSIVPQSIRAGKGATSITINGANFLSGQSSRSVVQWNGQDRPTSFISNNQLVAFLTAADTALPATNLVRVVNPAGLGGTSATVPFVVVPAGSPEPEVEPNETSEQATLLLAPGSCSGSVAPGDAALITVNLNNGSSDDVEDLFATTLTQSSRLALLLSGTHSSSNLALYLIKEVGGKINVIGSSRFGGPSQRVTTSDMLAPGRYLVGVSSITGSSSYVIESSIPGS